jgi:hypothetical protein
MHFYERPGEDQGNLETVGELYKSKDMGIIAIAGIDHRKVASMDTFRTPYISIPSPTAIVPQIPYQDNRNETQQNKTKRNGTNCHCRSTL